MKMNITTPRIPSGFNEYLPADQIEFNRLLDIIRNTYEKYGFTPLDTPVLELSEVLLAKGGGETEQQIYRFERGRNDLSMRFDLTVPLARYVAQHQGELAFPFRRYQIGKVFRAERAQAGRFREFYQCDIDTIGSNSPIVDAEFPAIINEIFDAFGFGEFIVRINNRRLLSGFFAGIGLADVSSEVLRAIDKMEKISREDLKAELATAGCDTAQTAKVLEFIALDGSNDAILDSLRNLAIKDVNFAQGLKELTALVAALRDMKIPEKRFQIDLRIARGLDYYTGTVYETKLDGYPELGSVCSGGRYDDLASNYTKTQLPGVGISIGLSRLYYKLREAGILAPTRQSLAPVMVVPFGDAQISYALEVAAVLRRQMSVITYTEESSLGKKLKYADRMGVRYVVLIGEDETARRIVTLKDMTSGVNEQLPLEDVVTRLA
jgi:histidyl-tRNA synthetase